MPNTRHLATNTVVPSSNLVSWRKGTESQTYSGSENAPGKRNRIKGRPDTHSARVGSQREKIPSHHKGPSSAPSAWTPSHPRAWCNINS